VNDVADDYFLPIEAHFAMRRNTPFILSPKDWLLMKGWREAGIPLPVVIEAIDQVFEKNETSGRKKVINSLSYCRHAVKELWNERKEMMAGDAQPAPEEGPAELLERLASAIERVSPARAQSVRELAGQQSVPKIEERLIEIEREMIEELIASLPDPEIAAIRAEVTRALGDGSKLDPSTRARTEDANLRRIVRERFGVPRLSLF
jgi:hypothetical protein